jgi:hypothetical protein
MQNLKTLNSQKTFEVADALSVPTLHTAVKHSRPNQRRLAMECHHHSCLRVLDLSRILATQPNGDDAPWEQAPLFSYPSPERENPIDQVGIAVADIATRLCPHLDRLQFVRVPGEHGYTSTIHSSVTPSLYYHKIAGLTNIASNYLIAGAQASRHGIAPLYNVLSSVCLQGLLPMISQQ